MTNKLVRGGTVSPLHTDAGHYLAALLDAGDSAGRITPEQRSHIRRDMEQMLTVGASNAFTANYDELLPKGKNYFFADSAAGAGGGQRLYFPWDLDAVFTGQSTGSIYRDKTGKLSDYQRYITEVPEFRQQYNQIMLDLLEGPLAVASLHSFLFDLEAALTPSLLADPYGPNDVAGLFNGLRTWITARHANVLWQVQNDMQSASAASDSMAAVPEPSALAMLLPAALAAWWARRAGAARRRRSSLAVTRRASDVR